MGGASSARTNRIPAPRHDRGHARHRPRRESPTRRFLPCARGERSDSLNAAQHRRSRRVRRHLVGEEIATFATTAPMILRHRLSTPSILVGVAMIAFFAQGVIGSLANSQTFDESIGYASGFTQLSNANFAVNEGQPPFPKQLAAAPLFFLTRVGILEPPAMPPRGADREEVIGAFTRTHPLSSPRVLFLGRLPGLLL